eukprot:10319039-Alexandrium_andersonii.AAC.1
MQTRAPEALREARRLRRPHLESRGFRFSANSDPRRRPLGPSGELGPRAPGLDLRPGPILTRGLND